MDNHYHSYLGEAKRAHGEVEAERIVVQGLGVLGLAGQRLEEKPRGLAEKQVLAWWLRQRTTAGRRWISARLRMGEESRVPKAIRWVKDSRDGELNRLKLRLMRVLKDAGEKEEHDRE